MASSMFLCWAGISLLFDKRRLAGLFLMLASFTYHQSL